MTSITPAIALAPPLTPQVADMIGGKAAGLARLHAAGAHVPRWFVMTVIAFDEHVAQPQVQAVLAQGMAALAGCDPTSAAGREKIDEWSAKMQAAIRGAAVPAHHATTITNMLGELGPGPYAVRSSMLGEDSASHSFAGQLDSFLFRRDAAAVIEAVRNCQASAFSPRCLAYRLRSGLGATPPRVAVVVQRMIDGRISGVMFTAHPISGRRDHVMVAACPGLGEGIVSGACDTDEYVWSRDGGELSCTIATKQVQFVRADNDEGTHEVPVPEAQQRARCLTPDEVARIASEGARVAEAFGAPQDIEWTIAGDELFLLQARPITSLREDAGNETPGTSVPGAPGTDAGPRIVWDNSNIQESYCGVTTPLTFSFARAAYASVYEQTMRALGIAEPTIAAHAGMLRNMLGLHAGRVYYNINTWYRALLLLPSFGRNKADMEAMMGLDEPVDFVEDQR
ncbi:MAG: PEP/pyruvate-binding domain-containing protein, partial [Planctomycetota bacterium]